MAQFKNYLRDCRMCLTIATLFACFQLHPNVNCTAEKRKLGTRLSQSEKTRIFVHLHIHSPMLGLIFISFVLFCFFFFFYQSTRPTKRRRRPAWRRSPPGRTRTWRARTSCRSSRPPWGSRRPTAAWTRTWACRCGRGSSRPRSLSRSAGCGSPGWTAWWTPCSSCRRTWRCRASRWCWWKIRTMLPLKPLTLELVKTLHYGFRKACCIKRCV